MTASACTLSTSTAGVRPEDLEGFFEGWPNPPSAETHLALLRGSSEVVFALEPGGRIVGFITAITDGVLAAYIPLLEVRSEWRGKGIGTRLARTMLTHLERYYMVDVVCDRDLLPFYERLGLRPWSAAIRRNH